MVTRYPKYTVFARASRWCMGKETSKKPCPCRQSGPDKQSLLHLCPQSWCPPCRFEVPDAKPPWKSFWVPSPAWVSWRSQALWGMGWLWRTWCTPPSISWQPPGAPSECCGEWGSQSIFSASAFSRLGFQSPFKTIRYCKSSTLHPPSRWSIPLPSSQSWRWYHHSSDARSFPRWNPCPSAWQHCWFCPSNLMLSASRHDPNEKTYFEPLGQWIGLPWSNKMHNT